MLFKREPSVWLGAIQALLALLIAFKVIALNSTQTSLVLAFVAAVLAIAVALSVRPFAWPLLTGLAQTGVALVVGLGFDLTQEQQGGILTAVSVVVLILNRQNVTPEVSLPAIARRRPTPTPG